MVAGEDTLELLNLRHEVSIELLLLVRVCVDSLLPVCDFLPVPNWSLYFVRFLIDLCILLDVRHRAGVLVARLVVLVGRRHILVLDFLLNQVDWHGGLLFPEFQYNTLVQIIAVLLIRSKRVSKIIWNLELSGLNSLSQSFGLAPFDGVGQSVEACND